jgi:hypothetical protein
MIMGARRSGLPAVLNDPSSADRLSVELEVAAAAITGDGPLDRDRRAFLARASVQVASYGTGGTAHTEPAADGFRPAVVGDDLETRTG